MTARIIEENQGVGRVPDGTGPVGLRPEPASSLGHPATVPSRDELIANLEYATKLLGAFPTLNATAQVQHLRSVVERARLAA